MAARTPTGDVTTGTALAFTATGTDPDGDTLTYAWDFGDGTTSSAQNPSHAYLTAGSYTARVTVSDGRGGTGERHGRHHGHRADVRRGLPRRLQRHRARRGLERRPRRRPV